MSDRENRFWSKVDRSGDCWLWLGHTDRDGYGRFGVGGRHRKGEYLAHRIAYTLTYGEIPTGLCICHSCDTPACCNPLHLRTGTTADNLADRDAKGRQNNWKGIRNNHAKLTDETVRAIRNAGGLHREIAARFGISREAVGKVVRRERWAHVV